MFCINSIQINTMAGPAQIVFGSHTGLKRRETCRGLKPFGSHLIGADIAIREMTGVSTLNAIEKCCRATVPKIQSVIEIRKDGHLFSMPF